MPTYTQDVEKTNAIDFVHINPSIREGVNIITSMFGDGSAVEIIRYAPAYLINPSISGSNVIPDILTCNPGVVAASPSPSYTFQWRQDGVDIDGETSTTLATTIPMDDSEITCYVEAVNFLGMASGESNGITLSILEPVRVEEQTYLVITGLQQYSQQNFIIHRSSVITGLPVAEQQTIFGETVYISTGLGVEDSLALMNEEYYAVGFAELLVDLTLVNPGAELGDTSGWTVTHGTLGVTSTAPFAGTYSFEATSLNTVRYYQTITIPSDYHAAIDDGEVLISTYHVMCDRFVGVKSNFSDVVQISVECFDGSDVSIGTIEFDKNMNPSAKAFTWNIVPSLIEPLLPLTRSIRFHVHLLYTVSANGCQIDNHAVKLWTIT